MYVSIYVCVFILCVRDLHVSEYESHVYFEIFFFEYESHVYFWDYDLLIAHERKKVAREHFADTFFVPVVE